MSSAKGTSTNKILPAIAILIVLDGGVLLGQNPADTPEAVYRPGHGVTAPKAFYMPQSEVSDKARKENISGSVLLTMVVTAEGKVRDIKVIKGLGEGLDQQLIEAVRTWRFEPGTKNGRPVAVELSTRIMVRPN